MNNEEIQGEINGLKSLLGDTDYVMYEITESLLAALQDATAMNFAAVCISWLHGVYEDYGEIIRKRVSWRSRLRELERSERV